jgi:Uncharacterized protein containing DHHC-type Zn finger
MAESIQEAIEITKTAYEMWEYDRDCGEDWSDVHDSKGMAIDALNKQQPQPPIYMKGRYFRSPKCSRCNEWFPTGKKPNFCSNCGQAVKWE